MVNVAVVLTVETLVVVEVNVVRIVTKNVVDRWSVWYEVTVTGRVVVRSLVSVLLLVTVLVWTIVLVEVTGNRVEPLKKPANNPITSNTIGKTLTELMMYKEFSKS
ncbi:MAG: hypothetical protein QW074_03330 [Candidatus Caldarchaeum sp.]